MAIFSRTQKKADAPKAEKPAEKKQSTGIKADHASVLKNPRITEKATMLQQGGTYVFDVSAGMTKPQIERAVRDMYKVAPTRVRVVTIPSKVKRSMRTGRTGVKSGGRKAYVTLKKGDTITIA